MTERSFDNLLLEAIDEGLSSLGESVRLSVYFHLQKSFHIKREEIPERLSAFVQAVRNIFGVGSSFLEVLILKKLYEKVGEVFEWDGNRLFDFIECVLSAKRHFERSEKMAMTEELVTSKETLAGIESTLCDKSVCVVGGERFWISV